MKGAKHLFEEATDVNKCLSVIEGWLDKLKQLGEEVFFFILCRIGATIRDTQVFLLIVTSKAIMNIPILDI